MARLPPKPTVLRALLVKSGNVCAFPGCTHPIVDENHKFIAQVCHIEAAEVGGQRYNETSNDEYRRSFDNLALLCYQHHIETNDVDKFPSPVMLRMKQDHEKNFSAKPFKINEAYMYGLIAEMDNFWLKIEELQKIAQESHEYPVFVLPKNSFFESLTNLKLQIEWLLSRCSEIDDSFDALPEDLKKLIEKAGLDHAKLEAIPYYENPFENRLWDTRKIGFHNIKTDLNASMAQIEIKFLEEFLKTNPTDKEKSDRLEKAKQEFEEMVLQAGYID